MSRTIWSLMLTLACASSALADDPVQLSEAEHEVEIRSKIQAQDWAGAFAAWKGAVAGHPDSVVLHQRGMVLGSSLQRAGQPELAVVVADQTITGLAALANHNPTAVDALLNSLTMRTALAQTTGSSEPAIKVMNQAMELVSESPRMVVLIQSRKALVMAALDQANEATELVALEIDRFRAALNENADDVQARLGLAEWLATRAALTNLPSLATANSDAGVADLTEVTQLLDADWVLEHREQPAIFATWAQAHQNLIGVLLRSDVEAAAADLQLFREAISKMQASVTEPIPVLATAERSVAVLERRVETALKHTQLIGQPAMPILPAAWVNGEPRQPEALKGKVILVDFWAVWCGPCIATFPHLREWHEKYADQGFEVIGVTRYYKYDWDAASSRPIKQDELSAEAEQAAMQAFADHHSLKHVFAVTDATDLQEFYGVTGIPQAVLIDREGRVRLIKVGSGEANAIEIEKMIEQLLAE